MRVLSVCIFLFLALPAMAQEKTSFEKPDYKKIEQTIGDTGSQWYYPKLFQRYVDNDSTLSARDYHMLYFGYFFQDSKSPLGNISNYTDSIRVLNKKETWTEEDKMNFLRFSKEEEKGAPFQLSLLISIYGVYSELHDDVHANQYRKKCKMLFSTIEATGDGLTSKTGFHVLQISDEYSMIKYLGYRFGGSQSLTSDECDYMELQENDDKIKGLYFDVKQIFVGYTKALKVTLPKADKKKKK